MGLLWARTPNSSLCVHSLPHPACWCSVQAAVLSCLSHHACSVISSSCSLSGAVPDHSLGPESPFFGLLANHLGVLSLVPCACLVLRSSLSFPTCLCPSSSQVLDIFEQPGGLSAQLSPLHCLSAPPPLPLHHSFCPAGHAALWGQV